MGRPKKIEMAENVVEETTATTAPAEAQEEVTLPTQKAKNVSYSLSASFKTRSVDGDRITHKYQGVGKTLSEAIEGIVGSDEELVDEFNRPFPRGINMNVLLRVRTSAGYEFERNVAPHVAKDIIEKNNVALAARLLGV